jgi:hypothetical protein
MRKDWGEAVNRLAAEIYRPELCFRSVVLMLSLSALGMSFVLNVGPDGKVYFPFSQLPLPESCFSRRILGVDCAGCGMSRAFISISEGNFTAARNFNSASFAMYLFVVIQVPWQGLQICQTLKSGRPIETWWTLVPAIGMVVWLSWCFVTRN